MNGAIEEAACDFKDEQITKLNARIYRLTKQRKQLQKQVEGLTEYAWHLSDCAKIDLPKRAKIDMQCTCGLEQAQKQ